MQVDRLFLAAIQAYGGVGRQHEEILPAKKSVTWQYIRRNSYISFGPPPLSIYQSMRVRVWLVRVRFLLASSILSRLRLHSPLLTLILISHSRNITFYHIVSFGFGPGIGSLDRLRRNRDPPMCACCGSGSVYSDSHSPNLTPSSLMMPGL